MLIRSWIKIISYSISILIYIINEPNLGHSKKEFAEGNYNIIFDFTVSR